MTSLATTGASGTVSGPAISRRQLNVPLTLTLWTGISALSLAQDNGLYFLAGTLACGVNLVVAILDKNLSAHRLIVNLGMLATTAFSVVQLISGRPILMCLGQFIILIQIAKLFDRKANRDVAQLLLLSVMNVLVGALSTESLWFALALLAYVVLLCHTGMTLTLFRGLDNDEPSGPLRKKEIKKRIHVNAWMPWPRATLMGRLSVILGFVLITGVTSFLVLPRAAGLAATANQPSRGKAPTFGGPVQLGKPRNIVQSDQVVMYVTLDREAGQKVLPLSARYLRGQVFHIYENKQWSRRGSFQLSSPSKLPPIDSALCSNATVLNVSMLSSMMPHVFAPHPLVRVESPGLRTSVNEFREGELRSGASGGYVRYTTWSLTPPCTPVQREYLRRCYRKYLPPFAGDPRRGVETSDKVKQLAMQWCSDLVARRDRAERLGQDDAREACNEQIADRLAIRLRDRCTYTLDLTEIDPKADPLEEFLFRLRRGHCEYFASALTVMCRSLGVPARLVTGFVMNEYNPSETRYVIRQNCAHAWTEVYTAAGDWVVKDATPAADRVISLRPWYSQLAETWDNLEFLWFQTVLNYDDSTRSRLVRAIENSLEISATFLAAGFNRLLKTLASWLPGNSVVLAWAILLAAGMGCITGLSVLIWRLHRWQFRRQTLPAHCRVPPELLMSLRTLLDLLARRGLLRRPGQTLREYTAHAGETLKLPSRPLEDLIRLYYQARWGAIAPSAGELAGIHEHLAQICLALGERKVRANA